ncbi:sensor histidine kinase [Fictibacillus iocasae]|uniref:Heme sensor protein HssS n=1 Tax=Fictibacillus iocasae TaxID=2715437 RepID=A0ABW2NU82_9BACL
MKSLYSRIVVTTLAVMLLSSFFGFLIANGYYHIYLKPFNDQKITKMAEEMQGFIANNRDLKLHSYLEHTADLGYNICLADESGIIRCFGKPFAPKKMNSETIQSVMDGATFHGISTYPSNAFVTGFFKNDIKNSIGVKVNDEGTTYALFVRPNTEKQFGELRLFFSVLLVLTILISMVIVLISTTYLVKPLRKLAYATKRIASGTYDVKLNVNRDDEIGRLAKDFSTMSEGLKQLEQMRQEFVSNVSHEIQSPLASIQGFAETLRSSALSTEERDHYLRIIEEESKRLSQLSKQLLTLASLDTEEKRLEKKTFDVSEQIKQVVRMTEYSWREKELALELDLPSASIYGDENLLYQVWANLIQNSIKFSTTGDSLFISLQRNKEHCTVTIKDTGIGMTEHEQSLIFQRFYKADTSRSRNKGGSGLGLAIVQKIVQLHSGDISVTSSLGEGSTFTIKLPIHTPS